jgi:hypothetical protein
VTKGFTRGRNDRVKRRGDDEERDVNGNGSLIRGSGEDESATRPAIVGRLRDQVQAGRYRPPVDEVVERLAAFLTVPRDDAPARRRAA